MLEQGPFGDVIEQKMCDQTRTIRKNGWLTEIELEITRRRINTRGPHGTDEEENQNVADSLSISDELVPIAKLNISINKVLGEEIIIVNALKETYDLGEKTEGIIFKKVDFMRLNAAVRKVNNVLRFFKTSNITETNNFIVASSVWVSRQLELKKARRDTLVVLIFALFAVFAQNRENLYPRNIQFC